MELREVTFAPVMNASGTLGFFGEGYWYHNLWKFAGLTFKDCGFTAKTTTMQERLKPEEGLGNMPMMQDGITPREFVPRCIILKPWSGVALNAVGLSGPGAPNLLTRGIWQQISGSPWNLSFMGVEKTQSDRADELQEFVQLLLPDIHYWNADVGLELNFSCPNAHVHISSLVQEVKHALQIANELEIPMQCKFNALAPIDAVREISSSPLCTAIVMGNTIPWGQLPNKINWQKLFGSHQSPLQKFGGGGLSGPPLRAIHCEWINTARQYGISKPIWGCGGVDSALAVSEYKKAGASGVQIGTVAMMRPWRMRSIKRTAHELFS